MEPMSSARCACTISARYAAVLALLALVACGPAATQVPQATEAVLRPSAPVPAAPTTFVPTATTPKPAVTPPSSATATVAPATPQTIAFPLAEPGPYRVGKRRVEFEDTSRNRRSVRVTVWYPALAPTGSKGDPLEAAMDLPPDISDAPYPLLLSSTVMADILAPYLVSHGFTWASVDIINSYPEFCDKSLNHPLDIRFALSQVAVNPPEGLTGMIDADHAGAIGYSFDGFNTLALSGARVDPEYYLAQCPTPDATTATVIASGLSAFDCAPAAAWDDFAALAGEAITTSGDGLWQPITDERIRAVMPLAGEGWWLFGERGLAAVDRPALMLVATEDELYPENVLIFKHLGTPDKTLISFIGRDHMMMVEDEEAIAGMAHFATAFFGHHLQERADLRITSRRRWLRGTMIWPGAPMRMNDMHEPSSAQAGDAPSFAVLDHGRAAAPGCPKSSSARARRRSRLWRSSAACCQRGPRPGDARLGRDRRSCAQRLSAGPLASGRTRHRPGGHGDDALRRGSALRRGGHGRHKRHPRS